jgi:hypothetical protein
VRRLARERCSSEILLESRLIGGWSFAQINPSLTRDVGECLGGAGMYVLTGSEHERLAPLMPWGLKQARPAMLGQPAAPTARPDLGVSARQVSDYDWAFQGKTGERFKDLVAWAAKEVDVNPGLLAVNLIAETRRGDYLTKDRVSSFLVGADDFYEKRHDIAAKVPAFRKVKWDEKSKTTNVNERGRRVTTIKFASGRDALLASAVYLKHGEVVLRQAAKQSQRDFDTLPVEVRLALLRLAFNAGHGRALRNLREALEGKDVLIRKPRKKAGPQRRATIHAARAMHLSETVFGVPPI